MAAGTSRREGPRQGGRGRGRRRLGMAAERAVARDRGGADEAAEGDNRGDFGAGGPAAVPAGPGRDRGSPRRGVGERRTRRESGARPTRGRRTETGSGRRSRRVSRGRPRAAGGEAPRAPGGDEERNPAETAGPVVPALGPTLGRGGRGAVRGSAGRRRAPGGGEVGLAGTPRRRPAAKRPEHRGDEGRNPAGAAGAVFPALGARRARRGSGEHRTERGGRARSGAPRNRRRIRKRTRPPTAWSGRKRRRRRTTGEPGKGTRPPTPWSGRGGGAAEPRSGHRRGSSDRGRAAARGNRVRRSARLPEPPGSPNLPAPRSSTRRPTRGRPSRRGPAGSRRPGRGRLRRAARANPRETRPPRPRPSRLRSSARCSDRRPVEDPGRSPVPAPRNDPSRGEQGGRPRRHREKREEKTRRGRNFARRPTGGRPRRRFFSARSSCRSGSVPPLAATLGLRGLPLRPGGPRRPRTGRSGPHAPAPGGPVGPADERGPRPAGRSGAALPVRGALSDPAGFRECPGRSAPAPPPEATTSTRRTSGLHGPAPAAAGPQRRPDPPPSSAPDHRHPRPRTRRTARARRRDPTPTRRPGVSGFDRRPERGRPLRSSSRRRSRITTGLDPALAGRPDLVERISTSGPRRRDPTPTRRPGVSGFDRRPERGRPLRSSSRRRSRITTDSTPDSPDDRISTSGPRRRDPTPTRTPGVPGFDGDRNEVARSAPPPVGAPESPPDSTPHSPDDRTSSPRPDSGAKVGLGAARVSGPAAHLTPLRAASPVSFEAPLRSTSNPAGPAAFRPGRGNEKSPGAAWPRGSGGVRPKQSGRSGQDAVGRCGAGFLLSWTGR